MSFRDIRNRFRLIPFGKFSISGRGKPPYNQNFVGRRRERAAFIELLTHQENFGAFLISGRRGSGKSSFVEYALKEYQQSSLHRFIRFARSANGPDLAAAISIGLLLSLVIVLAGQAVELISHNAYLSTIDNNHYFATLSWAWILLVPLTIGCLGLFIFLIVTSIAISSLFNVLSWGNLVGTPLTLILPVGAAFFTLNMIDTQSITEYFQPFFNSGDNANDCRKIKQSTVCQSQSIWSVLVYVSVNGGAILGHSSGGIVLSRAV